MPVFDGAMNAYGYSIGAAPFCDTSRKLSRKRSAANGSKSNSLIRSTSGWTRCTTSATLRIWRRKTSFTSGADSWATSWPADARFSDALNVAKRTPAFGGAADADADVSIAPAMAVTNNRFILSPLVDHVRGPSFSAQASRGKGPRRNARAPRTPTRFRATPFDMAACTQGVAGLVEVPEEPGRCVRSERDGADGSH